MKPKVLKKGSIITTYKFDYDAGMFQYMLVRDAEPHNVPYRLLSLSGLNIMANFASHNPMDAITYLEDMHKMTILNVKQPTRRNQL